MLRSLTVILVAISVVFMVAAAGCSESDDTIVVPPDDSWTPCPDYIPGVVCVYFDPEAPLADIDIVVRGFGLTYTYIARGEIWVHAHVVEGDPSDVQERLSASPLVDHVDLYRNYLRIRFVVEVTADDALAFVASYPELAIAGSLRDVIYVEYEVTVGDEDEWVNRFLEEDLVIHSHRAVILCPTE